MKVQAIAHSKAGAAVKVPPMAVKSVAKIRAVQAFNKKTTFDYKGDSIVVKYTFYLMNWVKKYGLVKTYRLRTSHVTAEGLIDSQINIVHLLSYSKFKTQIVERAMWISIAKNKAKWNTRKRYFYRTDNANVHTTKGNN